MVLREQYQKHRTPLLGVGCAGDPGDRDGKTIALTDLRAGDTVYIRSVPGAAGSVAEIRKGPMTLEELRRRYLQKKH